MPTYQYACTECGHAFEQVQSFSDDALTECPVCQGRLRKVFNAVGVVFKGSGFYRTDSRTDSRSGGSAAVPASGESGASSPTPSSAGPSSAGSSAATPSSAGERKTGGSDAKPAASSATTSSAD